MRVLVIGDVVGKSGCDFLISKLPLLKKDNNIDFCIVNGENSAEGNGITAFSAGQIFDAGADVITTGNHVFKRKEIYETLDEKKGVIRPFNYPLCDTGEGYFICEKNGKNLCVINLLGVVYMDSIDNPFNIIDSLLEKIETKYIVIDFHAEATAEKIAFANYVDGRVSLVFGTHTHVQTADECIMPSGTGYITDVGMTGPINSVLGVNTTAAIKRFKTHMPIRFSTADGNCKINGIVVDIEDKTGKTSHIARILIT